MIIKGRGGIRSQLFTGNGTFLVPLNVGLIWVDAIGGGAGGAGGHNSGSSGAGGGAGPSGVWVIQAAMPVTPGETLQVTVGGPGSGGSIGANGTTGGDTKVLGELDLIATHTSGISTFGTATAGGSSTFAGAGNTTSTVAGANGVSRALSTSGTTNIYLLRYAGQAIVLQERGGGGGGPGYDGGKVTFGRCMADSNVFLDGGTPSGSAGSGMGGGGAGACSPWGKGGTSGAAGAAGGNASGYGAGGGGGGCNGAGGNGTGGFVRIYWTT